VKKIQHDILATLAYFDLFRHPLTQKELFLFLPSAYNRQFFARALNEMVNNKIIYRFQGFYSLVSDPYLIERRNKGYAKAIEVLKTAKKIAAILSLFPYIRGVAVSGSLSKYYADEHSDIDFFIITAKNRLWIARTVTHLLKKISFLFRKQHLLCMNYFIDEQHLEIEERNIFTATEIITLLPMKGANAFERFYSSNKWIEEYLPNHFMRVSSATEIKGNLLRRLVEIFFNNPIGTILDKKLMNITAKRWAKKTAQRKLNEHGMIMSMFASRHYSKPDPSQFQAMLLNAYRKKLSSLLSLPQRDDIIVAHQTPGPIAL
jgi:predicted nucleotidyltransferase